MSFPSDPSPDPTPTPPARPREARVRWVSRHNPALTGCGQWLSAHDAERLCEVMRGSESFVYSVQYRETNNDCA
jgi:hypothetical protein